LKGKTIVHASKHVSVPPEQRNMGMVFQSFAVWPHLTVEEHVAFPLIVRRVGKKDIQHRVNRALSFVNLSGLEKRLATQLSGGQQQRLALARALVYEPDVLLLDEPLSNLDAKLREQMRIDLKKLHAELGTTLIFVTHDQLEAMTLADRVVLMKGGHIEQIGSPDQLYTTPATPFVNSFLGTTISFEGVWINNGGGSYVNLPGGYRLAPHEIDSGALQPGGRVLVAVRPKGLRIIPEKQVAENNEFVAEIKSILFLGDRYEITFEGCGIEFALPSETRLPIGERGRVVLGINSQEARIWPL